MIVVLLLRIVGVSVGLDGAMVLLPRRTWDTVLPLLVMRQMMTTMTIMTRAVRSVNACVICIGDMSPVMTTMTVRHDVVRECVDEVRNHITGECIIDPMLPDEVSGVVVRCAKDEGDSVVIIRDTEIILPIAAIFRVARLEGDGTITGLAGMELEATKVVVLIANTEIAATTDIMPRRDEVIEADAPAVVTERPMENVTATVWLDEVLPRVDIVKVPAAKVDMVHEVPGKGIMVEGIIHRSISG